MQRVWFACATSSPVATGSRQASTRAALVSTAALISTAALMAAMLTNGCSPAENGPPTPPSPSQPPSIETLRSALSERDELERTYELTRYLRDLSSDDIPSVLVEIERHRVGITADEVRLFMLAWTRFDGPGALETARTWPTPWKTTLTEQAIQAWGFNDGRAALAAWERIEDEELREKLRGALVAGWVGSYDIEGITEFAATVEKPRRRNRLAFRLTGQVMRDGPEAVIAWRTQYQPMRLTTSSKPSTVTPLEPSPEQTPSLQRPGTNAISPSPSVRKRCATSR